MWNIVKTVKKGEYLYAIVPGHPNANKYGYVLEHRVVAENKIGRLLKKNEVVHHVDENKKNNAPENLEVMTKTEHASLHGSTGRTFIKFTCPQCGKVFTREKKNRPENKNAKNSFCSRKCNGKYNWKNSIGRRNSSRF